MHQQQHCAWGAHDSQDVSVNSSISAGASRPSREGSRLCGLPLHRHLAGQLHCDCDTGAYALVRLRAGSPWHAGAGMSLLQASSDTAWPQKLATQTSPPRTPFRTYPLARQPAWLGVHCQCRTAYQADPHLWSVASTLLDKYLLIMVPAISPQQLKLRHIRPSLLHL